MACDESQVESRGGTLENRIIVNSFGQPEALFNCFKLEDHVPKTHLLRLIDRYVDLGFVRDPDQSRKCGAGTLYSQGKSGRKNPLRLAGMAPRCQSAAWPAGPLGGSGRLR